MGGMSDAMGKAISGLGAAGAGAIPGGKGAAFTKLQQGFQSGGVKGAFQAGRDFKQQAKYQRAVSRQMPSLGGDQGLGGIEAAARPFTTPRGFRR